MTGRCCRCHYKTVALPGVANKQQRPHPSEGWRLGYVIEKGDLVRLICLQCCVNSQPTSIAA